MMPSVGRNYLDLGLKSEFRSQLFRNFGQVNYINCFSIMRSHYCVYKSRFEVYKLEAAL